MKRLFSLLLTLTLLPNTLAAANTSPEEACGEGGCSVHWGAYHSITRELIDYVGSDAYYDGWKAPFAPDSSDERQNIVNFVQYFAIPRETFEEILADTGLLNTDTVGGPNYYPDIIYSGDPELIEAFYSYPASPDTGR